MMTRSPLSGLKPPGYRSKRATRRRRTRRLLGIGVLVAVIALVAGGTWLAVALTRGGGSDTSASSGVEAAAGPSKLVVLSLKGEHPLAAVVGAQGAPDAAVVSLPDDMTFNVPGQGDATLEAAAGQPGATFRVAVSNLIGVWADHYAVMDRAELAAVVDRMDGITIDLAASVELGSTTLGPGPTQLTGEQVRQYLGISGPNLELRWELVLNALFVSKPLLLPSDVLDSDDATAATALLADAQGASVQALPVKNLGGDIDHPLIEPDSDALPDFVSSAFGAGRSIPVPVVVVNGSGAPGVGERVAARVVPAGFRVVLSQNADSFGRKKTAVIASGSDHVDDAQRAQEALGAGQVQVTDVPSGVADVTIVIGKDFGRG